MSRTLQHAFEFASAPAQQSRRGLHFSDVGAQPDGINGYWMDTTDVAE